MTYRHDWIPADALEALTVNPGTYPGDSRDTDRYFSDSTLAEAIDLVRNGYVDIVDTINVVPNISTADVQGPFPEYGESGTMVDVPLYLEGEPECMIEIVNAPQPKPLVKI